jgi:hypothetical protein
LKWTPFIPFAVSRREIREVPAGPGVYRVRVAGQGRFAYLGQTGRNLRERLGDLMRHTLADEMPFNDPHTAAPKLWSYRQADGLAFVASAAVVESEATDRLGLECFLLWCYRTEAGTSTLCNFGRLAPGYRTSRNRTTGLRGGLIPEGQRAGTDESLPPLPLRAQPDSADWMGLDWSGPEPLRQDRIPPARSGPGVYRLMRSDGRLVYIGQTDNLDQRLQSHCPTHRGEADISFSLARMPVGSTLAQRLEWETDLIGAYYGENRMVPERQFVKSIRPASS